MSKEKKDKDKTLLKLLDSDEVNEPQKLPMRGCTGPKDTVSKDDQRNRRDTLANLLAGGRTDDEIYTHMARREYGEMTERGVDTLMVEVFETWAASDKKRSPYKRHAAEHRLLRHIALALKNGQYTAVAQLEKILMLIQGTAAETRVHLDTHTSVDVRINEAAARVLKDYPTEKLQALMTDGIKRLGKHGPSEPPPITIDQE